MIHAVTDNRRRAHRAGICLAAGLFASLALQAQESFEPLAAIRAAAETYVRAELPGVPGASVVSAGSLDSRLRLGRCTAPLGAGLPAGATLQARNTIGVSCPRPSWTVYVPVTVESRISVLILKRPVAAGTRLTREDVEVQTRKVTGLVTAFLGDTSDLKGRTARRALAAGTALAVDMFVADTLVHRGQDVTLVASSGTFEVRAAGRALADAPAGARLRVQNLSSMKVVEGMVESSDVVRVAQ
jgi:flagella basal body P-ring formation protein FlgA